MPHCHFYCVSKQRSIRNRSLNSRLKYLLRLTYFWVFAAESNIQRHIMWVAMHFHHMQSYYFIYILFSTSNHDFHFVFERQLSDLLLIRRIFWSSTEN